MQPPVDLKGFYASQKQGDKLFQEGIFTIFNEIDEIRVELDTMLKPNGSQVAPARSCYDLFLCQPSFTQGAYGMLYNPSLIFRPLPADKTWEWGCMGKSCVAF